MHLVSCWMSNGQAVLRKSSATVAADRICWSAMQQRDIAAEMERARVDFHHLLDNATSAELRARTNGTKWTNEQLLFHMLFGYLLVHNLLILVKAFTRLPRRVSKAFAATLDAATRPFHVVNYLGSLGGARVLGHARMERLMDFVTGRLQQSVTVRTVSTEVCTSRSAGPVLQGVHDRSRCVPLRHPALRPPPTPTHIGSGDHGRGESSSTQGDRP